MSFMSSRKSPKHERRALSTGCCQQAGRNSWNSPNSWLAHDAPPDRVALGSRAGDADRPRSVRAFEPNVVLARERITQAAAESRPSEFCDELRGDRIDQALVPLEEVLGHLRDRERRIPIGCMQG